MDKITIKNVDLFYQDFQALKNINLSIEEKKACWNGIPETKSISDEYL